MPDMTHVLLVQAVCLQFPRYRPNQKPAGGGRIDWGKMAHITSLGSVNTHTGFDSAEDVGMGDTKKSTRSGSPKKGSTKGKSRAGSQLSNM